MEFFAPSLFEEKNIKNPLTYKGFGRPRKSDYINGIEAQKLLNYLMLGQIIIQRKKHDQKTR